MTDQEPPSPSGDKQHDTVHDATDGSGAGQERGSWLSRLFGGNGQDSRQELLENLEQAQTNGVLDADAAWMIQGVLGVAQTQVRDIMVPRGQMVVVEAEDSLDAVSKVVIESGHSRFPVIGESRDEVVGILLAKDLLSYIATGAHRTEEFVASGRMREPVYVPESKRLNVLLKEFRASRNHMAIVVDEYGGISGLVTIEDVLEQIVGEIDDEYDEDEAANIVRQSEAHYAVRALTPIEDFNEYFKTEFADDEFDTVGGLVVNAFGRMPRKGEEIDVDGHTFTVLRADTRRVQLFQFTPSNI